MLKNAIISDAVNKSADATNDKNIAELIDFDEKIKNLKDSGA